MFSLLNILSLGFLFVFGSLDKLFGLFKMFHSQEFKISLNGFIIFGLFAFESFLDLLSFGFVDFGFVLDFNVREKVDLFNFVLLCDAFFLFEFYFGSVFLLLKKFFESLWSFGRVIVERGDFVSTIVFTVR